MVLIYKEYKRKGVKQKQGQVTSLASDVMNHVVRERGDRS